MKKTSLLPEIPMKKSVHTARAARTFLAVLSAMVLLTACPQSKLPDVPTAPKPKALVQLQQHALEI